MKSQKHTKAPWSVASTEPKKSALALNSDVPLLRGKATASNKKNINAAKGFATATVVSVVDGHKGVPIAADALFLRASDLSSAFSTASESDLLNCGLTEDELEDLQVKYKSPSFSETQKKKSAWQ